MLRNDNTVEYEEDWHFLAFLLITNSIFSPKDFSNK